MVAGVVRMCFDLFCRRLPSQWSRSEYTQKKHVRSSCLAKKKKKMPLRHTVQQNRWLKQDLALIPWEDGGGGDDDAQC